MLQKQPIDISFAKGLDTKTDPWRVQIGNFLSLQNSIFTKLGQLQKRNGFNTLTIVPDPTAGFLTTYNGGLTAIGSKLSSYSSASQTWTTKGTMTPMNLASSSILRNNLNQQYADSAVSSNGLVCTVYTENNNGTLTYKYIILDQATEQVVTLPTAIVGIGTTIYAPRVFYLAPYFIVVFDSLVSSTNHLQFIAISQWTPNSPRTAQDISTVYSGASTGTFDGVVYNGNLYLAYNATGTTIQISTVSSALSVSSATTYSGNSAKNINVTIDLTAQVIWVTWIDSSGNVKTLAFNQLINPILAPTLILASSNALNVACTAQNGILTAYYEVSNNYGYDSSIPTHFIGTSTVSQAGTVTNLPTLVRSVGLASKAFLYNGVSYFFALYNSTYQPTYFLINGAGQPVATFAYQNGPSAYYVTGLPTPTVNGANVFCPYLYKDLIQAVNKNTNVSAGTQVNGIYSQTGIYLVGITFGTSALVAAETGGALNIAGGFLTSYDGIAPVEQNFFLYPDSVEATWSSTGGSIPAQPSGYVAGVPSYYYQVTYEWIDNQGNINRSGPSIPVGVLTSGSGTTGSVTINVPTLRLTYKTSNPVKIVVYRWSVAQQVYYQVTSITAPTLNSITTDYVTVTDTLTDAQILGNNILYTTGGVLENIHPPATSIMALFNNRLWMVDSEDRNLLWYSKQIIEATPVEMSDLLTVYVAPTTSSQATTGPITALSAMDDKLIIFKKSAIYYINGIGPDNTGANSQYSDPIFITSTVGCVNPASIVFTPQGLMFQSQKGIWVLGRDLSTNYIGAPVEAYNSYQVLSSINIPDQNQVRFSLSNGVTLMFDYFFQQWGTFTGISNVSSAIFSGLHTFINSYGNILQESPGTYLDGTNPVLMQFTTSWINLAGIQGYQRAYFFYLIGQYYTPHKLNLSISYDYNDSPEQSDLISPDNFSSAYGNDSPYGQGSPYGGNPQLEQWRVFLARQRCQSFQINFQEVYDGSYSVPAGKGLTLSGLNLIVAIKKGWRPIAAANTVG